MALLIVATPIGNKKDITLRALEVLGSVDLILCEDTRHSGALLSEYNIRKPLLPFHEHNEQQRIPEILKKLIEGQNIALVSDAGTPLISDPGFKLVRAVREIGLEVTSLPGPSALVSAISISGLPTDKFLFLGYLPKSPGKINALVKKLVEIRKILPQSFVLYETPHRIKKTLEILENYFPKAQISVQRELTKLHEEVFTGKIEDIPESLKTAKGEFTLVIY